MTVVRRRGQYRPRLLTAVVASFLGALSLVLPVPSAAATSWPICDEATATIVGTAGPDQLSGTAERDVIVGLGGDDDIVGLGGNDVICGGDGADVLRGGDGTDRLFGGIGNDVLVGGAGPDFGDGGIADLFTGTTNLCGDLLLHLACQVVRHGELGATATARTDATTATVRGIAPAGTTARLYGAAAPADAAVDPDGIFAAAAVLRPAQVNQITVTVAPDHSQGSRPQLLRRLVTVHQTGVASTETVSGRVLDSQNRPVSGAQVSYGPAGALSGADGTYTLQGLPAARIAIRATAAGHLGGLAVFDTTGETTPDITEPVDIMLQPLAAPVTIGPDGGAFDGLGYRVNIPAGAVTAPTSLMITPLVLSGDKDGYGLPIVDLSPSGLRFARPITVDLDPAVLGIEAVDGQVMGLDPDTGAAAPLESTVVNGKLRVSLRTLAGIELRTPIEPEDLGLPCTSYSTAATATATRLFYLVALPQFLLVRMGGDSAALWIRYLQGGVAVPNRRTLSASGLDAFRQAPATTRARDRVVQELTGALQGGAGVPALQPPTSPAEQQVKDFGIGQDLQINYGNPYSVPGNTAGNVGRSSPALGSIPDSRAIDGPVRFVPEVTARGVLTEVTATADLKLTVLDSIDLCPGDIGNSFEQYATIALSRLEVTPLQSSPGTYATPQLFKADPDLDSATIDVTSRYPTNDSDSDGVPHAQPWQGATFTLDNCPSAANPDQADRDGDGQGDACDDPEDPEDPPPPPPRPDPGAGHTGPAGSYGDPHLLTFDGLAYDFQATGDYVVAADPTRSFEVQYRFARQFGGSAAISYNRGAAARVGDSVIAFGDDAQTTFGTPMGATLDGQPVAITQTPTDLPGGATVRLDGSVRVVRWSDGTELRAGQESGYSSLEVRLSQARQGQVGGLFGNGDTNPRNDLAAADGVVVDNPRDPAQLYDNFGASWRAEGAASLFRTPLPNLIGLPVLPSSITSISELSPDARAFAEQVCRARGLQSGAGLEQCILDVGLTGDPAFAEVAAGQADRLRDTVDATALVPNVETTEPIAIGERAAGSLDSPFAVDVFTVTLAVGDDIRVEQGGACPSVGTFGVTLISPSGRAITRSQGAGCGSFGVTDLRESGSYQLRVQDTGGFTGNYGFDVSGVGLGFACDANQVGPSDDGSSPEIPLPFTLDFGGRSFSSLWVNNNGNVTFDGPLGNYTPVPLDTYELAIIAAWWADVYTVNPEHGEVRYGLGEVGGRRAFCVDSHEVAYYGVNNNKRNSFQLYLVDRADVAPGAFDIVLRYTKLQWESGNASGGSGGLGGTSASVGYTSGTSTPGALLELPGSRISGSFLDGAPAGLVNSSTGTTEPGVHIFPIR